MLIAWTMAQIARQPADIGWFEAKGAAHYFERQVSVGVARWRLEDPARCRVRQDPGLRIERRAVLDQVLEGTAQDGD